MNDDSRKKQGCTHDTKILKNVEDNEESFAKRIPIEERELKRSSRYDSIFRSNASHGVWFQTSIALRLLQSSYILRGHRAAYHDDEIPSGCSFRSRELLVYRI